MQGTTVFIFYSFFHKQPEEADFSRLLNQLPGPARNQVMKFKRWEDRQRSLLGKLLLATGLKKLGLGTYRLEELRHTDLSRPYFDNLIDFNISHSGGYVMCAMTLNNKLGIDVEEIKDIQLTGFESQFSPAEWLAILQTENALYSFYTLWTRKEAFLKAIGTGITIPLNEIDALGEKIHWNGKEWFLYPVQLDQNYVAHLATNLEYPEIVLEKVAF